MGAYAPAPWLRQDEIETLARMSLQPVVEGMRRDGTPYAGILYAGLMLTRDGPRVLEYNCRFGDPETQVILPLLESDLTEVLEACVTGRLREVQVRWRDTVAATVVAAAPGYPGDYPKGLPIAGVAEANALDRVAVFHSGTRRTDDGAFVTSGGRVLSVTGVGADLPEALINAYRGLHMIRFEGMHYRRDIGHGNHRRDTEGAEDGSAVQVVR
jgi:phosphoribosylamine--glycine ligase